MRALHHLAATLVLLGCTPTSGLGGNTFVDVPQGDQGATDVAALPDVATQDQAAPPADLPATPDVVAAPDVMTAPDVVVVTDVPSTACMANRECPGGVCDRVSNRCVRCLTAAQCGGATPVCANRQCVAATACVSSRMCPGQVCDTVAGRCVDCVTDPDCPTGTVCRDRSCVAAPAPCVSSRQCSPFDQVCDGARGVCVDCVGGVDCPMGQFCTAERSCAPQACVPNRSVCADARTRRICAPDGSGSSDVTCASGTGCRAGVCVAQTCRPGAASCASMTARQVCNDDGFTQSVTPCPSAANAGSACAAGACSLACAAGFGDCDGSAANGCETDLGTSTAHCGGCGRACAAGQVCGVGRCDTSVPLPAMPTARNGLGVAVTPDGTLYAVGGQSASSIASTSVESWSPSTNTWSTRTALPRGVWSPGVVTGIDGRVYVVGGRDFNSLATTNVYAFDAARNAWDVVAALGTARHSHAVAAAPSGQIYAISGRSGSINAITNSAEVYDPTSRTWTALPVIPNGVSSARAVAGSDGRVWVFGGNSTTIWSIVQVYDPVMRSWSIGSSMPYARYGHGVVRVADTTYIVGGDSVSQLVLPVYSFILSSRQYVGLAGLPSGRLYFGLAALLDGRIVAVGGSPTQAATSYLSSVAAFTPSTNTWR